MKSSELTGRQLAELLDLTPGRISQLAAEGRITRLPNGKYPPDAVQEYITFLRDLGKSNTPMAEAIDREKVRKLRRMNDAEDALVAPVGLLEQALEKAAAIIVAELGTLPDRIRKHWPEATDEQLAMVCQTVEQCQQVAKEMRIEVDQ